MGRVAIFGDIGGHAEELYAELVRLGACPDTLRLPDDLTVVQVGDLVHKGPDSPGVLDIVERALDAQPDQWVQLTGNHESQYFARPRFTGFERLDKPDRARLRQWWADGRIKVAAAVETADGEQILLTHAGLTCHCWFRIGEPADAAQAAEAVNAWIPDDPQLWRAGLMLGEGRTMLAGPWWAEAGNELYASWAVHTVSDGLVLPFSQVHGHSSVFWFGPNRWRQVPLMLRDRIRVDTERRHVTVSLPGGRLVGVDPDHSGRPAKRWAPLVLPDARVTAR